MQRKKIDVDVIMDILLALQAARPDSSFVSSLLLQYQSRGGLSKKQLEGLYQKALKVKSIPPHKLATLEAEILKRPTRFKSALPPARPMFQKDARVGEMIAAILQKAPQHKAVLSMQVKYENNTPISPAESAELQKFYKIFYG